MSSSHGVHTNKNIVIYVVKHIHISECSLTIHTISLKIK